MELRRSDNYFWHLYMSFRTGRNRSFKGYLCPLLPASKGCNQYPLLSSISWEHRPKPLCHRSLRLCTVDRKQDHINLEFKKKQYVRERGQSHNASPNSADPLRHLSFLPPALISSLQSISFDPFRFQPQSGKTTTVCFVSLPNGRQTKLATIW